MNYYVFVNEKNKLSIGDFVFFSNGFSKIIDKKQSYFHFENGGSATEEMLLNRSVFLEECLLIIKKNKNIRNSMNNAVKECERDDNVAFAKYLIYLSGLLSYSSLVGCTNNLYDNFKKILPDLLNIKYSFMFEHLNCFVIKFNFNNKVHYSYVHKERAKLENGYVLINDLSTYTPYMYIFLSDVIVDIEEL